MLTPNTLALRRLAAGLFAGLMLTSVALPVMAQSRGGGGGGQQEKTDEEIAADEAAWSQRRLRVEKRKADGPCPFVKVLYEAARYHEFKDGREALSNAAWTGQINGVSSDCAYLGDEPIETGINIGFSLGRGPMAEGQTKVYRYWVAVTTRNDAVITKQYFDLPVTFEGDNPRQEVNATIGSIVIPRADASVSGDQFEILVGFDVTPQMVAFNRDGRYFRFVSNVEQK